MADPKRSIGYLTNSENGIDAISLQDGQLLWRSQQGRRPLLAFNNFLVAQNYSGQDINYLNLVLLDINNNGRLERSFNIELPSQITVGPTNSSTFSYSVRLDGEILLLKWQGRPSYKGGAPPPKLVENAYSKELITGDLRINLYSGTITLKRRLTLLRDGTGKLS